jgi:hypothetical protein
VALQLATFDRFEHDLTALAFFPSQVVRGIVRYRLARAVVYLEKLRRMQGVVPVTLPFEAWAHDPATDDQQFHYVVTSTGYRLWTAGPNGKDDAGAEDDTLVAFP